MRSRSILSFFVLLGFIFTSAAVAQTFRGSINGTVTDSSGAAVPGAQVKVSSPDTGLSRTTATNDIGEFLASELPLGSYSVTVTKGGYETTTLTGIPVRVGAPTRADVKLSAGAVQERVEVTAQVPLVETASNTTGGTIESSQAMELPLNGHDYTKLVELVPGATSDPVGSTESAGSYGLFSLNGNRGRSNNYLIDGTDMNDGYRNLPTINQAGVWGAPGTILPVDALAEIPVTGNPEAEFGRSAGATVNIVTKSGTNQIHGSAFEMFRDDALTARNYFNHLSPDGSVQPKNSFTNNQFGGMVSGPIVRDSTFFLLAYEGQRENGGLPQLGTVPTTNDIATLGGATNPVISNLLYTYKAWGTLPQSNGNVTFSTPFRNVSDNAIVKADQHLKWFSPEDLFSGRYFYAHGTQSFPLGMLFTGASVPGYNTLTPTHINIVSLSYTSVPRSNLIVEVRSGYNRFVQQFLPQDAGFDPTSIGLNTLPPGATATSDPRDSGLPTIAVNTCNATAAGGAGVSASVTPCSTIGATGSDSRGRIDSNYQLFGNISYTHGVHSFKAGFEWRRTSINSFINSGHRGKLVFDSLADFLSGTLDTSKSVSAYGEGTVYSYQNGSGAYFMDAWHMNPRITINYGLRWDYFGVVGAKNDAFSLFDFKTATVNPLGANGTPSSLYPKDLTNFAPRFSMADDLMGNGKLVVRIGGGIYYDSASQDFFVGNQAYNTYGANAGPSFNNIEFGYPAASTIPTDGSPIFGDKTNYSPQSAFTVDQRLRTPRYGAYNLNIESQLTKTLALQVGYVGSQGRHLFAFRDLDQYANDNVAGENDPCPNGDAITSVAYGGQCFPTFTVGSFSNIPMYYLNQIETESESNYNSLQTTLKIQNWHNLTSTLNYSWAHSLDTASDGQDFVPNAAMPEDSFKPRAEYANSNFDVRNRVQWYWSYNLPGGDKNRLLGGWALDGMFNFANGQPYTVHYIDNFVNDFSNSDEYFGRLDIVDPGSLHKGAGGVNLLNLAAFAAPCTWSGDAVTGACVNNTGHPGTERRNAFRSPNFTIFDFALTKKTRISENLAMELRADFFNILNHTNLSNPLMPSFGLDAFSFANPTVNPANPGQLLMGDGSEHIQTTATPDVATGNPYLGGGGPRSLQLSTHFTF
jgi:hypothetical protein